MTAWSLILSSARHYWRTHLGVVLGAALATLVLTGSLLVGDSVKGTLKRQALARVGQAQSAFTGGERFFREAIADGAPALVVRATIAKADGSARVNAAQILGVDQRFWKLSPSAQDIALPADGVVLNTRLATQLAAKAGDAVIIRMEKPGAFSRDAPLSGEEGDLVAIRAKVVQIVGDADFGRFALAAGQVPPFTGFVALPMLQEKLALKERANLLLSPAAKIAPQLQLADAALELRDLPNGSGLELRTSRVFLDPPLVAAAPQTPDRRRVDALTYFVNALEAAPIGNQRSEIGNRSTPYSMVTAVQTASSGFLPAELADDEIVISQWLADDLGVTTGGKVTVKYFVMGERRQLEEKARTFTVLEVLPMSEPQLNTSWMPDFPGLADKQNCRDWKPGFAFDSTRMRDKDQQYWEQYRGTPKAFVNLHIGQQMWGNRWGETTSLRWPAGTDRAALESALREKLTPEMLGFQFIPLREQALAATKAPVDFGQLFVSFSFFLIAAAAVLTGLLFVFTLEQRAVESGTLLALGLPQKLVRRILLTEGAVLALVGSVLGAAAAVIYTKLVLRGLSTVWRGAVGAVDFQFSANPATLPIGVVSGVLIAVLAMWLASRRLFKRSATELLSGEIGERSTFDVRSSKFDVSGNASGNVEHRTPNIEPRTKSPARTLHLVAVAAFVFALLLPLFDKSPGAFFGAGALLLIGGLMFALGRLRRTAVSTDLESLGQLGVRNAARRRGRSLATIAVLASGVFMVVAVSAFRKGTDETLAKLDSGTGGFALIGEAASPIYEDLNSAKGRETYALDEAVLKDVRAIPVRVRDGDDASCLNLNRALQPRLLGVKPEDLDAPQTRFRLKAGDAKSWAAALAPRTDGAVPGIVDANTLQWAMQKKVGDAIEYSDDRGQTLRVIVVGTIGGSMLQGSVLIAERDFTARFPNSGGYRFFLIDAAADRTASVAEELSRALQDRGLEVTPAARRLADFNAVENTYLSIFQVLGGLGLLLGSAGLAIVVARNVLERRREFGLLEAVGFRAGQLRRLVFAEHRWLIVAALVIGTLSALLAVWPSLADKAGGFPVREMSLLLLGLAVGCVFWTWLATRIALRGTGVTALRAE